MPDTTFLFAGGGSGGHVFPAVAIAESLTQVEPKALSLFLCSQRPVDRAILTEANVPFTAVPARSPSLRPLAAKDFALGFWRSVRTARKLLREAHVDRVVALGGFVAAPAVVAARSCRRPVTVVNLDVRPGRANRWLMRHCQQVLAAVSVAGPAVPRFADRVPPCLALRIGWWACPCAARRWRRAIAPTAVERSVSIPARRPFWSPALRRAP